MKAAACLGFISVFSALFCAAASAKADGCVLSPAVAKAAAASDVDEIQSSCDGLLVEQDSTRLKKEAWSECCQRAEAFARKEPIPAHPKAEGPAGNIWVAYRVRLALAVCDSIRASDLSFESHQCLNEMLFRIPDPRVARVLNECSPIGHHVGGRKHLRGGMPEAQAPAKKPGGTGDLLLNDESFSNCQHARLTSLLGKLAMRPSSRFRSEGSFHRRSTSASPRSAQTTE